jgi:membrane-associated phospholipid phosphatase
MIALVLFGTGIPIGVNLIMNYVLPKFLPRTRNISFDVRDFHLSLLTSVSLSQLLTHFMKNMTGRFRPCFYDMCQWQQLTQEWDGVTNLCTNAKGEKEGRKSFPSGHSSYAWATLFLLTVSNFSILHTE